MSGSTKTAMMVTFRVLLLSVGLMFSVFANAAIDAYPFPNDELRQRYNGLIDELRCPQCLNTNLAGSDAMIAKDLRREVHRMVLEGQTDDEILEFMYQRYGDFVLYKPRFNVKTMALWLTPLVLLIISLFVGYKVVRNRPEVAPISTTEQAQLDALISSQTEALNSSSEENQLDNSSDRDSDKA